MFYLNSDFTLVALAVTPFLLFFVARFKKSMKKATREVRKDQSNMFTILQEGLESMRAVNAFGRQDFDRHLAVQVRVFRPIDFAHSTCTEGRDDFVMVELKTGVDRHRRSSPRPDGH